MYNSHSKSLQNMRQIKTYSLIPYGKNLGSKNQFIVTWFLTFVLSQSKAEFKS